MQPVRVTSQGAALSLPLHMVAVGTGPTTGITIWVVADGRWEPKNFPTFTIDDSELVWDWTTSSSNYETLRLSKEAAFGGKGWQIESSLELNMYSIEQAVFSSIEYGVGGEGGVGEGGGGSASSPGLYPLEDGGAVTLPEDATAEDSLVRKDLAVLFAGINAPNVRVTRMRSDVAHSALSADMVLQASADQHELTNRHYPKKTTGDECPYGGGSDGGGSGGRGNPDTGATNGQGCSTTGPLDAAGTTVAVLVGLMTFGAAGVRRRRRGSQSRQA